METSVEIPPISSRIYEFALVNAYIDPTKNTFDKISVDEKSIEKVINNIKATKDCRSNKERRALNQDLKNQDVEVLIKVKIAKGVIRIKTFKIMYLKEYVNNRFNKLIEIKLFNNPSNEKTFKLLISVVTMLSSFEINSEKLILQLKMFSPISRIEREIKEFIFNNCSIKK